MLTTPTAKCSNGHTHISAYEAMRCDRNAPAVPTSYDVPQGWASAPRAR